MQVATVAVDIPTDKTFDYALPPDLAEQVAVGHLVQVSFGTGMQPGIVIGLADTPGDPRRLKPILEQLDAQPVVTPAQIAVSRWLAATYLSPLGACLWLWLPPGLVGRKEIDVTLLNEQVIVHDSAQKAVISLLARRGALRGAQIGAALPDMNWRAAVDGLAKAGIVAKTPTLAPPRARPRIVQTAALAVHPAQIETAALKAARPSRPADLLDVIAGGITEVKAALKAAGAPKAAVDKLVEEGYVRLDGDQITLLDADPGAAALALRKLDKLVRILRLLAREAGAALDVSWIYAQTDATLSDLKRLEAAELIVLSSRHSLRDPLSQRAIPHTTPPPLTPAQEAAWERLRAALIGGANGTAPARPFLLHGVTGSGKTELYLRAIELTLALGRQAIFLVPEIALTPQTIARVAGRFPGRALVIHSRISDGERYDAWTRARDGTAAVVVGARSALWTPFPNVGLIVLDEEHDASYKQSASMRPPYYHARAAAEQMAAQCGALLVLGSATPDVETRYRAERGDLALLELPERVSADGGQAPALPPVQIVDMRAELRSGNTNMFSMALQDALRETLARREQAILFLNRRGQSTYVFCRDCGYVAGCPNCDTPLTFHRDSSPAGGMMRCHRCGYHAPPPATCPVCGSARIRYFGAGTQQVEEALKAAFPAARPLRWDADSAAAAGGHEQIMQVFSEHGADVLIGTQMVTKGLDLPLVTLVGVISADVGLTLPDFRANERAFQLLTQVAGRAGRGSRGGRAIMQTYQPDHYAVQAASQHDYASFYARELAYRREMGYPPFRRMARLLFRFSDPVKAQSEAECAAEMLRERIAALELTGTTLIGPAPCFYMKENKIYRWHLLIRSPDPAAALRGLELPKGWTLDIDPLDVL